MTAREVTLEEAKRHLPDLLDEAARGGEVRIVRGDGVAVRLVPVSGAAPRPHFGSAKGLIRMAEDFDAPLDDFAGYTR